MYTGNPGIAAQFIAWCSIAGLALGAFLALVILGRIAFRRRK